MALSDYQLSFGGVTFGSGTSYPLQSIEGLEAFEARSTDITIPNGWGALAGPAYVGERAIVVTFTILGGAPAIHAVENALQPNSLTPEGLSTLGMKLPDREELAVQARCDRRFRPLSTMSEYGIVEMVAVFTVPDPRKYGAAANTQALAPYAAISGGIDLTAGSGADLGIDLTVGSGVDLGLDMAGSTGIGDFVCTNLGNTVTYPTVTFSTTVGITSYKLTNFTNGDVLTVAQVLSPGETLVANMLAAVMGTGTPILYQGVARYTAWQSPRTPFRLSPGNNTLRFEVTSGSSSATCTVVWNSAYV